VATGPATAVRPVPMAAVRDVAAVTTVATTPPKVTGKTTTSTSSGPLQQTVKAVDSVVGGVLDTAGKTVGGLTKTLTGLLGRRGD
jgi:hypothetical protein